MTVLPVVSVWENLGTEWGLTWQVQAYQNVAYGPRYNDIGQWSLNVPAVATDGGPSAIDKVRYNSLFTFDWRGSRMTGLLTQLQLVQDEQTGAMNLSLTGLDALALTTFAVMFADPTKTFNQQPFYDPENNVPPAIRGPAEDVVLDLIGTNVRDRYGLDIDIPISQGRGDPVRVAPEITELWPVVQVKCKRGGIGLTMGLVNTTGTRADLTLSAYVPTDRSKRVRLSQRIGAIRAFTQTDTAPTATVALVLGAGTGGDRVKKRVTTTESQALGDTWGWQREVLVDGPNSFDDADLIETGEDALDEDSTTALALTAGESDGLQGFRDYNVGDTVTAQLATGTELVDVITGIDVTADTGGYDVVPTFGDPNAHDPLLGMGKTIRDLRRQLRKGLADRTTPVP